jgi:hypothetical protein
VYHLHEPQLHGSALSLLPPPQLHTTIRPKTAPSIIRFPPDFYLFLFFNVRLYSTSVILIFSIPLTHQSGQLTPSIFFLFDFLVDCFYFFPYFTSAQMVVAHIRLQVGDI